MLSVNEHVADNPAASVTVSCTTTEDVATIVPAAGVCVLVRTALGVQLSVYIARLK
jgi:hypothetical protein